VLNRSVKLRVPNEMRYVPEVILPMSEDIGTENFCHRWLLLYAGVVSTKIPVHIKNM